MVFQVTKIKVAKYLHNFVVLTWRGCSSQVASHFGEGLLHETLYLEPLLLGDSGRQVQSVDAVTHGDPMLAARSCH